MSNSVVMALTNFGRTLEDRSVEPKTKLHVLGTLNEVSLTLNELSESGVGRSVNKLKSEPGELGTTARLLITKWKRLLHEHLTSQPMHISKASCDEKLDLSVATPEVKVQSKNAARKSLTAKIENSVASEVLTTGRSSDLTDSNKLSRTSKHLSALTENYPTLTNHESHNIASKTIKVSKVSRKRKSTEIPDSLDSSCGLSFMESLNVGSSVHRSVRRKKNKMNRSHLISDHESLPSKPPSKPTPDFTQAVLSALNDDFDRPDIIHRPTKPTTPTADCDLDDGDLKFKSKRILWVPKPSRSSISALPQDAGSDLSVACIPHAPQSLIDLCLDTVERNLNRVDHVGNVPYELMARVLQHASAEDLARIEHCNPQYAGCSDSLWLRHIQRKFATLQSTPSPRPGETWLELYERLEREEADRLNRIINQSTRRMQEEQKSQRTTITTEAIMPRDVRRRISRQTVPPHSSAAHVSGKLVSQTPTVFKPYNVSHSVAHVPKRPVDTHRASETQPNPSGNGGRGLLDKLRKQFGMVRRSR